METACRASSNGAQSKALALVEYAQAATKRVAKLARQRGYLPLHLVQRFAVDGLPLNPAVG
jgi:hypothetical protein